MDLTVELTGKRHTLSLKNPILTASGTFGYGLEFAPYGDLAKLGGFIVKGLSLTPRPGNPSPRIVETTAGMLNAVGLQNDGVEAFLEKTLPNLPHGETAVICNIYASSVEDFAKLAQRLDTVPGIAAIEVNISCPNVRQGGILFGQDPTLASEVTSAVCEAAPNTFIIVKLSPNVTNIATIAESVSQAGADAISCINTLLGMSIDYKTRRPRLANVVGGLSGPAIKPVALRCVWQVASAVTIPVIGVGGITSVEDILEFIIAGAHAVQIGTANFLDPRTAFRLVEQLPERCQSLGIEDIRALRASLILE
ncbi:MAG: dihydroorotate dehydrogenase [Desulfovibrionaceae bacterium]|nr:dihydroorotate dehydrogenase [Desulfovibrionaceae bacterium]